MSESTLQTTAGSAQVAAPVADPTTPADDITTDGVTPDGGLGPHSKTLTPPATQNGGTTGAGGKVKPAGGLGPHS